MSRPGKKNFICLLCALVFAFVCSGSVSGSGSIPASKAVGKAAASPNPNESPKSEESEETTYQQYVDFFEDVYTTMKENYYQPIRREDYERFLKMFDEKIYGQLKEENKSNDYIRWRSAAYMIDYLKGPEDVFSAFYPPQPAKEYEKTALGKRVDLGIEGNVVEQGFHVTHVEPRSDAYEKGLRTNDLIVKIGERETAEMTQEEAEKLLKPLEDTVTGITYIGLRDRKEHHIDVETSEYFKQTVFNIPIPVDGIYALDIEKFNRKTGEDLFRFIDFYKNQGDIKGLIVDLRGNPGGPPLAAREISSFFLPGGDEFAYFKKRNQPKAVLDVPEIPDELKYDGPMVILVDEGSGSASELFSGVLQHRKRAVLMGASTAGQVMLKSMFHFDDESMLLLVTGRGHHPDGSVFSFQGLKPDRWVEDEEDDQIFKYAASYLVYVNMQNE